MRSLKNKAYIYFDIFFYILFFLLFFSSFFFILNNNEENIIFEKENHYLNEISNNLCFNLINVNSPLNQLFFNPATNYFDIKNKIFQDFEFQIKYFENNQLNKTIGFNSTRAEYILNTKCFYSNTSNYFFVEVFK